MIRSQVNSLIASIFAKQNCNWFINLEEEQFEDADVNNRETSFNFK